jgi:hypothetical protein
MNEQRENQDNGTLMDTNNAGSKLAGDNDLWNLIELVFVIDDK